MGAAIVCTTLDEGLSKQHSLRPTDKVLPAFPTSEQFTKSADSRDHLCAYVLSRRCERDLGTFIAERRKSIEHI